MTKPKTPAPDPGAIALSRAAIALRRRLLAGHEIEDAAGQATLAIGLQAWDRGNAARVLIQRDGAVVKDRFGQLVSHPANRVVASCDATFLQCMKALDLEPVAKPGRRETNPESRK